MSTNNTEGAIPEEFRKWQISEAMDIWNANPDALPEDFSRACMDAAYRKLTETKAPEHIVKGCSDCPFKDEVDNEWIETQYYCKHPKRYLVNLVDLGNGVITPSDCPLLKEPTTIKLVEE